MKRGILLVSFGTTVTEAWKRILEPITREVREYFRDAPVYEAVTSPTIRRILTARGARPLDVPAALERMAADGIEDVIVWPAFIIAGKEYENLVLECARRVENFRSLQLAPPLLNSPEDLVEAAQAVLEHQGILREDTALVLMGHGTDHRGDFAYGALDCVFRELGRHNVFVATVEGYLGLEGLKKRLEEYAPKRVLLRPFLLTAGEHVRSDMAGEGADSWKNVLTAAGYQVDCVLEGLGEMPAIRRMFLEGLAPFASLPNKCL